MSFKKTTLSNGVRIITMEMPQMRSVATTVYVKAGSRYESPKLNGISHFLEHMLFKGTKKYPEQAQIAMAIEGVGGQLNAWTDQDHTAFWNLLPAEFAKTGFEVLGEMIFHSLFEPSSIDRERGVILEEINRRYDDPASHVCEILVSLMWPDIPLGWPVIGNKENVLAIKRRDFIDYMGKFYQGNSIVVSVAGCIKHEEVVSSFEKLFVSAKPVEIVKAEEAVVTQTEEKVSIYYKKTDQAHLAIGVRGISSSDPDRYALNLMNTILGQGMSSRLFSNIREEKGLAYNISSGVESYEDTGALVVHAGLNLGKITEAISEICNEFKKLVDEPVSEGELRRAKDFVKGLLNLSMDDTDTVSGWYGRQELLTKELLTPEEVIAKIEKLTSSDLQKVAKRVFTQKNLNLALIGPYENQDEIKKRLKL